MDTPIVLDHPTYVSHEPAHGYRAVCNNQQCGWTGDWHTDQADGEDDCFDHIEVSANPPDDLDRLLNQLLDLQDDIAQLVIWLADHWTADLPVPFLFGRRPGRERPVVEVLVHCPRDTGAVEQVAQLLNRPINHPDHPALGPGVCRDFGMALFEAYVHPFYDTEPER